MTERTNNSMSSAVKAWHMKTLTDVWTGDINRESDRLITTGMLGSIRWWFEVLVRGLSGSACDPNDTKCEDRNHCVVCELFGCTGWGRKFRFEVLDANGNIKTDQIKGPAPSKQGETLSLHFTPLRPILGEEWALLDVTLRLIADYGAIGGKTVFKPTDESSRTKEIHHQDYGIVNILNVDTQIETISRKAAEKYVRNERWRKPEQKAKDADFSWASLKYFWFVNQKTLTREAGDRSSFNKILGRKESKACRDCRQVHNPPNKCPKTKRHPKRESEHLVDRNDEMSKWLAGSQQESKKVLSFKNPARTFGFVKPGLIDFNAVKGRLTNAWGQNGWDFLTGDKIIDQLFAGKGDCS